MDATTTLDPYGAIDVLHDVFRCTPEDCGDAQLADEMRLMQVMRNWLDGRFARTLGVFDARGGAGSEHALSTQAWVRQHCHVSATTAAGRVSVARRARDSDRLAGALESGAISYEHAVTIARGLDRLPAAVRDEAEEILLATARTVDPGHLKHLADTIREALAPETLVTDTQTAHDGRYLNLSTTLDGRVAVDGMLDPEQGALAIAAVRALATPTGPDDLRTAGQRRADGFAEAIRAGLDAGTLPVTGGQRPHMTLTIDFARFLDRRIPTARTATGTILAGETVRRILCDAQITRVVTLGPSEVLDVGTATRIWPPAIRRALHHRDGGCVGFACDRPPAWTDAHHVVHWTDGGPTSLDNGALLCRVHHERVHHDGWVMIRHGAGWIALPPDLAAINLRAAANGATLIHLPNPSLLPPEPCRRLVELPHLKPPENSVAHGADPPVP